MLKPTIIFTLYLLVFQYSLCSANEPQVVVRAGEKYLEVWDGVSSFQPLYVNGVNLSGVLPGHHATEPCTDQATYARWFGLLSDMNANTVRVFNTMPSEFYNALAEHNLADPGRKLWLIQGIWAELPGAGDFSEKEYADHVLQGIHNAVDAVHGSAGGADVSAWLLSYLFGREWESQSVIEFNQMYPELSSFQGSFVSARQASPMECWLAQICDEIVGYESSAYGWQHPVSFINWVATDPIDHVQGFKESLGEGFEVPLVAMEDFLANDAVSLSVNNLIAEDAFEAGLYASYHVYPYYPDFISTQPQYASVYDGKGKNSFLGYLKDLKSRYKNTPLLVTEYGLSSSPFAVHRQPQGWHHGGMSERQVAEVLPRLAKAVSASGCAGGAVFSWTDGWFKRVWLWNRFYSPPDGSRLWFNLLDPEQNYGILALEPQGMSQITLVGNQAEWELATQLTPPEAISESQVLVWATHDEGYLYLRVGMPEFEDWQFETHSLYVGLNVEGDQTGNFAFPAPLKHESNQGLELMLVFTRGELRLYQASTFRYWEALRRWDENAGGLPAEQLFEKNPYGWILPQVQTNSAMLGSKGQVVESQAWPVNPLRQGSLATGMEFESQAMWNVNPETNMLELRIPWMLAGFSAPHLRRVIAVGDDHTVGYLDSAGVGFEVVLADVVGNIERNTVCTKYVWDGWGPEDISYSERLKPVFYSLQDVFSELGVKRQLDSIQK